MNKELHKTAFIKAIAPHQEKIKTWLSENGEALMNLSEVIESAEKEAEQICDLIKRDDLADLYTMKPVSGAALLMLCGGDKAKLDAYQKGLKVRLEPTDKKWELANKYLKADLAENTKLTLKKARPAAAKKAGIVVGERQLINKMPDPR